MIQIPFGDISVPTSAAVTVAVPQADPLNFLTAQQPFQIVVFTAPAAEGGGGGVTSWEDLEDKPSISPFGLSLIDDADAATARTTLGLGTAATRAVGTSAGQVRDAADAAHTNARAPNGTAGGDLGGTYPSPQVLTTRGLRETAGPTSLTFGAIADGVLLRRAGSEVTGLAGSASGQVLQWSGTAWAAATPAAVFVGSQARLQTGANDWIQIDPSSSFQYIRNGSLAFAVGSGVVIFELNQSISFGGLVSLGNGGGVANVLRQSNGTNGQTWEVYNTESGSFANFERLAVRWASNVCTIETQAGGTGTFRPLRIRLNGVAFSTLPTPAAGNAGLRASITDCSVNPSGNYWAVASGGGAFFANLTSDGTDWRIG